jgi:hypothetical protein
VADVDVYMEQQIGSCESVDITFSSSYRNLYTGSRAVYPIKPSFNNFSKFMEWRFSKIGLS